MFHKIIDSVQVFWESVLNPQKNRMIFSYCTHAIVIHSLYILNLLFEGQKRFFQKILPLCIVSIQERFEIKSGLWWHYVHLIFGLQTSRGHKRWILENTFGELPWTFCPREFLFFGEFSWTFFWWIFVDTFLKVMKLVTLLSSKNLTYYLTQT